MYDVISPNSLNIQTANLTHCDGKHKTNKKIGLKHGVFYLQNIIRFYVTRLCKTSFTPVREMCPFFRRSDETRTSQQHCVEISHTEFHPDILSGDSLVFV